MMDGMVDALKLFLTGPAVPTPVVVCLAVGNLVAICWIVSLITTIRLQNRRIDEMATEKDALQKAHITSPNLFKSSIS